VLEPITRENVRAVCDLALADDQRHLVAPAAYTVAEDHYEPGSVLRAICHNGEVVGVLSVEVETGTPYLVRFMVDAAHQGQGIGRLAVDLLAAELARSGWSTLETSYVPVADGAGGFWRQCGFQETGREIHGEPLLRRDL
jgi:diamine N-acetyltransferase